MQAGNLEHRHPVPYTESGREGGGIQAKHGCPKNGQDPEEKSPLVFSCYPGPLPNLRVPSTPPLEGQGPFWKSNQSLGVSLPGRCVTENSYHTLQMTVQVKCIVFRSPSPPLPSQAPTQTLLCHGALRRAWTGSPACWHQVPASFLTQYNPMPADRNEPAVSLSPQESS